MNAFDMISCMIYNGAKVEVLLFGQWICVDKNDIHHIRGFSDIEFRVIDETKGDIQK